MGLSDSLTRNRTYDQMVQVARAGKRNNEIIEAVSPVRIRCARMMQEVKYDTSWPKRSLPLRQRQEVQKVLPGDWHV